MKTVSILGSTGSIGTQTLEIIRQHPDKFKIVGLTANQNTELLIKQVKEFKPLETAVMDIKKASEVLNFTTVQVHHGIEGLNKIATLKEADIVVNALVGSIGIEPTYNAIKSKKNVALANKETLVAAGSVIMEEAKKNNVGIIPVDSEHSAILQCIQGNSINDIKKIIITCSGGPFKNKSSGELETATVNDALNHPTWDMGNKITIDSATLMNKGFEVIEAHWLYGIPYDKIEAVIHPQSIVHSFVEFKDNSVIAQLGLPDMKIPIQYALSFPERLESYFENKLNLAKIKNLEFSEPDFEKFPCLRCAYEAGKIGGTMPAALNASNEVAVKYFLEGKIKFLDIQKIIMKVMDEHNVIQNPSLKEILEADKNVKEITKNSIENES